MAHLNKKPADLMFGEHRVKRRRFRDLDVGDVDDPGNFPVDISVQISHLLIGRSKRRQNRRPP